MAEDYVFTEKPIEQWSSEELDNAFRWDLIDKSVHDEEIRRRGFGAGQRLTELEELSRNLQEQQKTPIPPAPCCVLCTKPAHSVRGQRIVYSSLKGRNESARCEDNDGTVRWTCPECAGRTCPVCGSPHQLLMGLDLIDDQGVISHMAIFPVDPGCINSACAKHRVADAN